MAMGGADASSESLGRGHPLDNVCCQARRSRPRRAPRDQIVAGILLAILRSPSRIRPLTVPIGVSSMVAIWEWV